MCVSHVQGDIFLSCFVALLVVSVLLWAVLVKMWVAALVIVKVVVLVMVWVVVLVMVWVVALVMVLDMGGSAKTSQQSETHELQQVPQGLGQQKQM